MARDDIDAFLDEPEGPDEIDAFLDEPEPSRLEAGARGAAQGFTAGFADEWQAFARTAYDQLTGEIPIEADPRQDPTGGAAAGGPVEPYDPSRDPTLGAQAPDTEFARVYRERRDQYRANDTAAREAHPVPSFVGQLVGGGVSPLGALGTGARAAQGASLGARAAQGARAAAPAGALAGFGASEADLTEGDIGGAALDTALGAGGAALLGAGLPVLAEGGRRALAATGSAGQAVSAAAGRAAQAAQAAAGRLPGARQAVSIARAGQRAIARLRDPDELEARAGGQALKAAGLQGVATARKIGDIDDNTQLGVWMLRKGLIDEDTAVARPEIRANVAAMVKKAGEDIGGIRAYAQRLGYGPRAQDLRGGITRILNGMKVKDFTAYPEAQKLVDIANQTRAAIVANTERNGTVNPEKLDLIKVWLDRQLESLYASPGQRSDIDDALRLAIRNLFRDAEEKVIRDQLGPTFNVNGRPAIERFLEAKTEYGSGLDLLKISGIQDLRDLSNLGLGLREAGLLGMATMSGNPVTGVAAIAAKRLGDEFGNATAALSLLRRADAGRARAAAPAAPAAPAAAPTQGRVIQMPPRLRQAIQRAMERGDRQAAAAAAGFAISQNPDYRDEVMALWSELGGDREPQKALR